MFIRAFMPVVSVQPYNTCSSYDDVVNQECAATKQDSKQV